MRKILLVCLGNICRSPMAEGIFRAHIEASGKKILVDSAGTSAYHTGSPPDNRAIALLKKHNIDISGFHARPITVKDFDEFDEIYAMDSSNLMHIRSLCRNDNDRAKVKLLMDVVYPNEHRQVPDPFYGSSEGFEKVYALIDEAAKAIIAQGDGN